MADKNMDAAQLIADAQTDESVRGIYSTSEALRSGQEGEARTKQYWLAKETANGKIEVQPINERLIPIGKKRTIPEGIFREAFKAEPDFYIRLSEKQKQPGSEEPLELTDKAEPQIIEIEGFPLVGDAVELERNTRAGFGMGMSHLRRGDRRKAKDVFLQIADAKADFQPVHKHMFNDFGLSLRKQSMLSTAIRHYRRALELDGGDEHLLHNIARVYFEKKEYDEAVKWLQESLAVNPRLRESGLFLRYIRKRMESGVE